MPPDTLPAMRSYFDAGVTSVAFNLEVFERSAFKEMCPGKEKHYGYEPMLAALEYAVDVFGAYNVFSGFVWGLEGKDTVEKGYRWCLERGIGVSSNVFHADQGSVFAKRPHPTSEFVHELCVLQSEFYLEFPGARPIFPVSMRSTLDWEIHRGDFRR